jgi:hypothetical protein
MEVNGLFCRTYSLDMDNEPSETVVILGDESDMRLVYQNQHR